MASPMLVKVACLGLMCMVMGVQLGNGAIPCGQVQFTVGPCFAYLRGIDGAIPQSCCNGIRSLNNQAKSTPDRQGACRCIKSLVSNLPGLNLANLSTLPAKCGVNLPYKITPSIDCNTVH